MMSMIQNLRQTFVIFLAKWYSNKLRWLIQTMDQAVPPISPDGQLLFLLQPVYLPV